MKIYVVWVHSDVYYGSIDDSIVIQRPYGFWFSKEDADREAKDLGGWVVETSEGEFSDV